MKKLITSTFVILLPLFIFSQDITGLWKGTMNEDSSASLLPYELLIKKEKGKLTGLSYTRFSADGAEYYGIKKVKVSVAKDGKIVIKDDELVENNYPDPVKKNIHQLNILDYQNGQNETTLNGMFVTNLTKKFGEVTGQIHVKRINTSTESSLMQYLQNKSSGSDIAVIK
ncbi:MAG: hypothetical protein ACRDEB_09285 [Chitinophagaceae bacterium]